MINYQYHNVRLTGLWKDKFGWLRLACVTGRDHRISPAVRYQENSMEYVNQAKIAEVKGNVYLRPDIRMVVKLDLDEKRHDLDSFDFGGETRAG